MREFTTSPKEVQKKLAKNKELVVTNNGSPTMLVIDIVNRNFVTLIDYLKRQELLDILHNTQISSVRAGLDTMNIDEIDMEINAYRQEKSNI